MKLKKSKTFGKCLNCGKNDLNIDKKGYVCKSCGYHGKIEEWHEQAK